MLHAAAISLPKYKLIQLPEYLLLRRNTLRHACFPTLRSVQIRHDALHIPRKKHLPSFQAIVGCCWRQLVPFSVFYNLIYSLKEQAKKGTSTPKKGTSPRMTSLFKSIPEGDICLPRLFSTLRIVLYKPRQKLSTIDLFRQHLLTTGLESGSSLIGFHCHQRLDTFA